MSNDGLSNDEIVKLLFKNYMNFTSTSDEFEFFQETTLSNNTNIFSSNVLTDTPSQNPSFSSVGSSVVISTLSDFSVYATWVNTKTAAT